MVLASRAADGVPSFAQDEEGSGDAFCAGCLCGKMAVSPFSRQSGSVVKTAGLLDIVHSDAMGPMNPQSHGGARFVVAFVDDYSRYTGRRIRCLRSDNGREYGNNKFGDFFAAHGIVHETSTPYTPQQNGLAERMKRTLVEMARSMLYHRGMACEWWGEALRTAVYVTNRVPNTARPQSTPHEVFTGHKPDLSIQRVFGSSRFVHVDKPCRSKWDARAHAYIFLGYAAGSKAYRVQAPLELHDDVNLVQQQPVVPVTDNGCDTEMAGVEDDPVDMEVDTVPNTLVQSQHGGHEMSRRRGEERTNIVSASIPDTTAARQLTNQTSLLQSALVPSSARTGGTLLCDHLVFGSTITRQVRISAQQQPRLLPGGQAASTPAYPALPPSEGSTTTGEADRFSLEDGENNSASGQEATGNHFTSDGGLDEPDAKRPIIDDEYSLRLKAFPTLLWVFALKRDEHGNIIRYKARLVALGRVQTYGVDYTSTYSPVANLNTVRIFLAVCYQRGYMVKHYDVETAFLNGDLEEEVYMVPQKVSRFVMTWYVVFVSVSTA
ncbi:unnamed protein product [Phytophthora fragariaefolia]|uniref:Unnamed protein product n=1 Tax=Phytophthora fragariaefolia TaxID=1490495 RepID=A0A9W6XJC2_9STRA|nr:unnamed protein product [Phytophthora fragariaefolia]